MSAQEPYDEYAPPQGFWGKVKRIWSTEEPPEGDADGASHGQAARRRADLRLDTSAGVQVSVRLNAVEFNDARLAADGLKAGHQQIVNLEQAAPPMAERILDFLKGVAYALDGTVERIGDRVYLFAPANVTVEIDGGVEASIG